MITASTLHKRRLFNTPEKLTLLENSLLSLAAAHDWQLEAWSVFSNHYHFIARGGAAAGDLRRLVARPHADTARDLNRLDGSEGRKVRHNFRDTRQTWERSYLARPHHVHQDPVRHGLVPAANLYEWCSAAWFERTATPATVKTSYSFEIDRLKIEDDY